MLGEQEQKVGQFRVGEGIPLGEEHVAQLTAGGEQVAEATHVVLAVGEGPARRADGGRAPAGEKLAAALAEGAQDVYEQILGPVQQLLDPAPDLAALDSGRVAAEPSGQRGHREPFDDEGLDDGEDLAEAGGLVRQMRAGGETREAAVLEAQLLDDEGPRGVTGCAAALAIATKRPEGGGGEGADHLDPGGMILGG